MKTKDELPECPVATTVSIIGSKRKLLIIRKRIHAPDFRCDARMGNCIQIHVAIIDK